MSQDENPDAEEETQDEKSDTAGEKKAKHKVIADVHSGMVLVAPVATPIDESDESDEKSAPESSPGPLN